MNEFDSKPGSTLRARAIAIATDFAQSSARDIAYIIFRRKAIILSFFFVILLGTLAYIYVTPFTFQSNTQLLIRQGRENIAMDTSMVEGRGVTMAQNAETAVSTAVSILKSQALADQVVAALGQDAFIGEDEAKEDTFADQLKSLVRYGMALPKQLVAALKPDNIERVAMSPEQVAARRILRDMAVEPERRTNIVNVSFTADSPEGAQQTLEKIVERFLVRHIEVHAPQTSAQFFEDKLQELEEILLDKQKKRDDYLQMYGIGTVQSQKDSLVEQINTAEVNRSTAASEIGASQAKIVALEAALVNRPETIITSETENQQNPTADKLKDRLAELRLQESEMSARYSAIYRPLVELRQQIEQVEEMLAAEETSSRSITTALDPGYQQIKLELDMEKAKVEALQAREKLLAVDVDKWRQKLASLTEQEGELARLTREFNAAEKEFLSYQDGFLRARTSKALDMDNISNVNVVQPATYSATPAAPNVLRILALGLFLGLFGGVSLAFGLEYIDSKVYTKEDVEKHVSTPVLAVITEKEFASTPTAIENTSLLARQAGKGAESKDLVVLKPQVLASSMSVAEKMFSLSRRITVLLDNSTAGIFLMFASAQGPRDSSKLVREYAQMMVRQGRRVLVLAMGPVSCPLVTQGLPTDQQWEATMNDGLVMDDFIHQVGQSQLYFTQMGDTKDSLRYLSALPQFDPLIWKIRGRFDLVLVDCPPMTESSVATRMAQLGDGVVLVVDAGKTRWQVIQNQVRDIQVNQGRALGVILNNRKFYIPKFIYQWL